MKQLNSIETHTELAVQPPDIQKVIGEDILSNRNITNYEKFILVETNKYKKYVNEILIIWEFYIWNPIDLSISYEKYKKDLERLIDEQWENNIIKKTENQSIELYNNSLVLINKNWDLLWHTWVLSFTWDKWEKIWIMWTTLMHEKFKKDWEYTDLKITKKLLTYREEIFWKKYNTLWVITKVTKVIECLKGNWFEEWNIPMNYIIKFPNTVNNIEKKFLFKKIT